MNGNDLMRLGYPSGKSLGLALEVAKKARRDGVKSKDILDMLTRVLKAPEYFTEDATYSAVAQELLRERRTSAAYDLDHPAPYTTWGEMNIEPAARDQMARAVRLPVAIKGALMPDAHVGYGLPIGGVLATENAAIPYAVGVDIACRMRMTIFDARSFSMDQKRDKYRSILENNTKFGPGRTWSDPVDHPVMSDKVWNELPWLRSHKDTAHNQLGTSGSGNHFVEFGGLNVYEPLVTEHGTVPPGEYLAVLSHSGSRRLGMEIANHYTEIAMKKRSTLPKDYLHLAWLELSEHEGHEYWLAMNLAGRYAAANHQVIHEKIADAVRLPVVGGIENHHNFLWEENVDGRKAYVHRKGATPAGEGVLGIIPGSMGAPGFVVRGKGNPDSLNSASHGAGRRMSRIQATRHFEWDDVKRKLKAEGVELISGGLDEAPGAYKDIRQVMADQADLVETMAEFRPKLVKMDGSGARGDD
jgi:tRNA-splicing ligase RtcB (3'-phosphate/5'-hydroxy nucleic acid ligase)